MAILGDLNPTSSLYRLYQQVYGQSAGDESGSSRPIMSEAQFNALPESQRYAMAGEAQQTNMFGDGSGNAVGYGDPNWLGAGSGAFVNDPSQITRNDGRFSVGYGNINEDALLDRKNETDRSGFFSGTPLQNFVRGASVVGAGALAGNYFLGSGAADAASGYGLGGSAGEGAATGGMGGMGGGGGLATDIAPGYLSESVAPTVTETMSGSPFGGGSMWDTAVNYATKNPVQTARGVSGLLGAATSGSGDSSSGGGSGGSGWSPSGPAPTFNPMGGGQSQQSAYQPLQFDPVPFMGDSQMFQNYSPYGNSGFTGMGMPGQNPTMQSQGGFGYNQASPVQLPWMQGNQGGQQGYQGSSNPSFGKPYMQGGGYQPQVPQGMGYAGSGPVQAPPGGWGQPSQGAAQGASGGLLGNMGNPPDFGPQLPGQSAAMRAYGSSPVAGMDNRTFQMMARYLPNSGTGVDPVASPGTVQNKYGGDWAKMIPQNLQGQFQQFQNAMGGMTDYNQFRASQGRPEINYGGQGTRWNPWS